MAEQYTSSCIAVEVTRTPQTEALWKHHKNPHITLLYVEDPAGKTYSLEQLLKIGGFSFGNVTVTDTDMFGEDNNYLVLQVESDELHTAHRWYKRILPRNEHSFPKYRAHITIANHDDLSDSEFDEALNYARSLIGQSLPLGDTVLYFDGKTHVIPRVNTTIMGIKPHVPTKQEKYMGLKSLSTISDMEVKALLVGHEEKGRFVRTPAGAEFFGLPIGAPIPAGWKRPTIKGIEKRATEQFRRTLSARIE